MNGVCFSVIFLVAFYILILRDTSPSHDQIQQANAYIDDLIAKATNDTAGFIDSLPLDDYNKSSEKLIGSATVRVEAKLYDGKIEGLSTLQRVHDASLMYIHNMIIIACRMSFKNVETYYRGVFLVNDSGPNITLNATVGFSYASMLFAVPTVGGDPKLLSFNIIKFTNIRVTVHGLGPLGWGESSIRSLVLNVLQKPVVKTASAKLHAYFYKEIKKYPYPG